jgi:DNA primase large subunit
LISEREAAKYPFLKEAISLVDILNLSLEDLSDPNHSNILERAEERVSQAILKGSADSALGDPITELLSFPVANMFINVLAEDFLDRRYALSEALRVSGLLADESDDRIAKMARTEFKWILRRVRESIDGRMYGFEVHFEDYLRNASSFREPKWKLVNRLMRDGYVLLTKPEAVRLLQEEVRRKVFGFVSRHTKLSLPELLKTRIDTISKLLDENRSKLTSSDLPSKVIIDVLPPCIARAFKGLMTGRRAAHMERFALTSFLIHAGMEIDDIVKLFVSVTDFDETFTRYQIEHIAGLRGSRTKYTPPTCSTLRTHGVCINPDRLCQYVKHPLGYYRIKVRDFQEQKVEEETKTSEVEGQNSEE